MSLVKCEECEKEISNKVKSCPHCGCPVRKRNVSSKINNNKFNILHFVISITVLIIITIIIIYFKNENLHKNRIKEISYQQSIDIYDSDTIDDPNLPSDLNDEQLNILKKLHGTWELNKNGSVYRYIFSGMKVQCFSKIGSETFSYVSSLSFSKEHNTYYLVDDYNSNDKKYYCVFNDMLSVNTYDDNTITFLMSISNKISDNDDFTAVPKIGMTAKEVLNTLWGEPKDINKTTTKYGNSEQWVYDNYKYVYFDNGLVTSIQE